MKLTTTEILVLGVLIIALIQYLKTDNSKQTNSVQAVLQRDFNNAQQQLYSWVGDGSAELDDIWNIEKDGFDNMVYYNDK